MKPGYERWLDLPTGVLELHPSERLKKKWVKYYLERNYQGWKPVNWDEEKEKVLVIWEGRE